MACLFIDGFDKYGPVNNSAPSVAALMQGEWTIAQSSLLSIVTGLSSVGQGLQLTNAAQVNKTLPSNVARIIGGVRFNNIATGQMAISFADTATFQCSITHTSTGAISFRTGGPTGTILGTTTGTWPAASTHYLEWDITFGASSPYQLWVDGISVLSGTGATRTTANNYANVFVLLLVTSTGWIADDLYLFDTTGTANNTVLLTSPRVETTYPVSDSTIQFAVGASIFGSSVGRANAGQSLTANNMGLRPITAVRAMTLNTLFFNPTMSSPGNIKLLIYADSAGIPGALLGQTPTIAGLPATGAVSANLTSPVTLTAATQYWVGLMTDSNLNSLTPQDLLNLGRVGAVTFTSGAPSTAPAMSPGQGTYWVWGAVTLTAPVNFYEVSQQPPPGIYSYVYDSVVGHEDLYNFGALSVIPTSIYAVAVKSWAAKSDTGTRTMSMRMLSAGVDSGGSLVGQALGTTFQWYDTMFETDPGTGAAWTGTNLNAAQSGFRIDT